MRRFSEERAQQHTLALLEISVYLYELSRNKALPVALREQAMVLFQDYPSVTEIIILAKRDQGDDGGSMPVGQCRERALYRRQVSFA